MLFFLNGDGTMTRQDSTRIFQGANNVTTITVIAPFGQPSALQIAFTLPNGIPTQYYLMAYNGEFTGVAADGTTAATGVYAWTYDLPYTVTEAEGTVLVSVQVVNAQTDAFNTSYSAEFTVEYSVLPSPPSDMTESDFQQLYTLLSSYYTQNVDVLQQNADLINTIQGDYNSVILRLDTDEANIAALQKQTSNPLLGDFTLNPQTGVGTKYYKDGTTQLFETPYAQYIATVNRTDFLTAVTFTASNWTEQSDGTYSLNLTSAQTGRTNDLYVAVLDSTNADTDAQSQLADAIVKNADGSISINGITTPFAGRIVTIAAGGAGTQWHYGTLITGFGQQTSTDEGLRSTTAVGDFYLNTETCEVFVCSAVSDVATTWDYLVNIKGAQGEPSENSVVSVNGQTGAVVIGINDIEGLQDALNAAVTETQLNSAVETLNQSIAAKADASALTAHVNNTSNPHQVTAAQVGLGNVSNVAQIPLSQKGEANGVATLDANGKVPLTQINDSILGQMKFVGLWNATTGAIDGADLREPAGRAYLTGDYYICMSAGTLVPDPSGSGNLTSTTTFEVGDWLVFTTGSTAAAWGKVDNTDAVSSVCGKTGAVTLDVDDITGLSGELANFATTEALASETSARESADTTLQEDIDAEATARENADTTLQNNITAEATARQNADNNLQTQITANTNALGTKADTTALTAETQARQNADNGLQQQVTAAQAKADTSVQYVAQTLNQSQREQALINLGIANRPDAQGILNTLNAYNNMYVGADSTAGARLYLQGQEFAAISPVYVNQDTAAWEAFATSFDWATYGSDVSGTWYFQPLAVLSSAGGGERGGITLTKNQSTGAISAAFIGGGNITTFATYTTTGGWTISATSLSFSWDYIVSEVIAQDAWYQLFGQSTNFTAVTKPSGGGGGGGGGSAEPVLLWSGQYKGGSSTLNVPNISGYSTIMLNGYLIRFGSVPLAMTFTKSLENMFSNSFKGGQISTSSGAFMAYNFYINIDGDTINSLSTTVDVYSVSGDVNSTTIDESAGLVYKNISGSISSISETVFNSIATSGDDIYVITEIYGVTPTPAA